MKRDQAALRHRQKGVFVGLLGLTLGVLVFCEQGLRCFLAQCLGFDVAVTSTLALWLLSQSHISIPVCAVCSGAIGEAEGLWVP